MIPGPTSVLGRRPQLLETGKWLDLLYRETVGIMPVLAQGSPPFRF